MILACLTPREHVPVTATSSTAQGAQSHPLASSYTCSPPHPARPAFTEPVIESKKAKTARAVLVLGAPGGRPWNWKEEEGSIGTCKLNWIPSSACMCLCSAASDHAIPPGKHAIKMLVSKKQNRERERERCYLNVS